MTTNEQKICPNMGPLFHYCEHYFNISLINLISFTQTLYPITAYIILIFHCLILGSISFI